MIDFPINTTSDLEAMYPPLITGPYVLFAILTFIISSTLLILIFAYLNNVALVKECVLWYLYKDVVIIVILINCMRLIIVIVCYSINGGLGIGVTLAKVMTFAQGCLAILLHLLINILNAVKCYMSMSKLIDPPMPWGDDDLLGIRMIRFLCSVFTTGLFGVMYALGMYPKVYYILVEQNAAATDLPENSYTFFGVVLFLVITESITGIVAENGKLPEKIIPRQMNYFLWTIPTIAIVLITLFILFEEVFYVFKLAHPFQIRILVSSILYTITPAIVIYRTNQLKSHTAKVLKNKIEEAFLLSIYVAPAMITLVMNFTLYIIYQLFDI